MVGFLRAFAAASAVPAAAAAACALSSSSCSSPSPSGSKLRFPLPASFPSASASASSSPSTSARAPRSITPMAAATAATADPSAANKDTALPELTTEFMVDMKCEGCVKAVRNKLETLEGLKNIEVDLNNQVVRVLGSLPVKTMLDALQQTGRDARLIGQGNPNDFLVSAAVAEFKGPVIFGVVRLAQVNMELTRVEATFSGLSPGKHGWSINEFGDLTRGAESTGKVYNPPDHSSDKALAIYCPTLPESIHCALNAMNEFTNIGNWSGLHCNQYAHVLSEHSRSGIEIVLKFTSLVVSVWTFFLLLALLH